MKKVFFLLVCMALCIVNVQADLNDDIPGISLDDYEGVPFHHAESYIGAAENDSPWHLPCIIEGEHFDRGAFFVSWFDVTTKNEAAGIRYREGEDDYDNVDVVINGNFGASRAGNIVGYIKTGDWFRYTIYADRAGDYTFYMRTQTTMAVTAQAHMRIDEGELISATVGGRSYTHLETPEVAYPDYYKLAKLHLTEGPHILTLSPSANLDKILITEAISPTTYSGLPFWTKEPDKTELRKAPCAINVVDFDSGMDGVAFRQYQDDAVNATVGGDPTSANGGNYRVTEAPGIDICANFNAKGLIIIPLNGPGAEFYRYTVEIPETGEYKFDLAARITSPSSADNPASGYHGYFHITIDDGELLTGIYPKRVAGLMYSYGGNPIKATLTAGKHIVTLVTHNFLHLTQFRVESDAKPYLGPSYTKYTPTCSGSLGWRDDTNWNYNKPVATTDAYIPNTGYWYPSISVNEVEHAKSLTMARESKVTMNPPRTNVDTEGNLLYPNDEYGTLVTNQLRAEFPVQAGRWYPAGFNYEVTVTCPDVSANPLVAGVDFKLKSFNGTTFVDAASFTQGQGYLILFEPPYDGKNVYFSSPVAEKSYINTETITATADKKLLANPTLGDLKLIPGNGDVQYYKYDGDNFALVAEERVANPFESFIAIQTTSPASLPIIIAGLEHEVNGIPTIDANDPVVKTTYFTIQGQQVPRLGETGVYIVKQIHRSQKVTTQKVIRTKN
jgi:hypothetical protein